MSAEECLGMVLGNVKLVNTIEMMFKIQVVRDVVSLLA